LPAVWACSKVATTLTPALSVACPGPARKKRQEKTQFRLGFDDSSSLLTEHQVGALRGADSNVLEGYNQPRPANNPTSSDSIMKQIASKLSKSYMLVEVEW
jgi:hypothetical protein